MNKTPIDKNHNYVLIDTNNGYDDNEEWRSAYKQWCEDMEMTEDEISFDDWLNRQKDCDEEEFWNGIKDCSERCIVTGYFNSRYPDFYGPNPITLAINPVESVYRAFQKCVNNAYYYKVEVENDVIKFTNWHHDGTEHYEIRLVSEKTYDKLIYDGCNNQDNFMNNKNNFLNLYWELFGC